MHRERRNDALRLVMNQASSAAKRLRRHAFIKRTKLTAIAAHATIDISVAADADISRGVRVEIAPWSTNTLHIGPGTHLGERVLIRLTNGIVRIGDAIHMRRDCVLNVSGELVLAGDSLVSWGTIIHCDNRIVIDRLAVLSEQVTIVDSSHYFTEPDAHLWHNVRTGTVDIGRGCWICAKATVTRDVKIGDHSIVAAGSVVISEVPSGSLASGVPATVRPLVLPW